MKVINIRMSESAWAAIRAEADVEGVSASEFVREAVFFRLGYRWAKRMADDELALRLARLGVIPPRY